MSYRPSNDYNLDVRRGLVAGHAMVGIRGHDDGVPNGGPFSLSPGFGLAGYTIDQSAIAATPAVLGIASTDNTNDIAAGTGALTVLVSGLDASGVAQSEAVTMTGTTAALTIATFSAVHTIVVLTTGSNNANTGIIYVGTGTFTAGVPAVRMGSMKIGDNISSIGYYVVPTAKTIYFKSQTGAVAGTKDSEITVETSTDGILWLIAVTFPIKDGVFPSPIVASPGFVAGTHIRLSASGSAASTIVTFILEGELVDD
jgi:hypothetical protein